MMRAALVLGLSLSAGCAEDPVKQKASGQAVPVCLSSFRADVRAGPSAGAVVSGVLAMTDALQGPTASFLGGVEEAMDVPMTLQDEAITLDFSLPSGTVHGTGSLPFSMDACDGEMEGPLMGPQDGDSGDWLGTSSGSAPYPADLAVEPGTLQSCIYDLGPGSGGLSGALVIGADEAGGVAGVLVQAGATGNLAVTGEVDGGTLALELYDASGLRTSGSLSLDGTISGCDGSVSGDLGGTPIAAETALMQASYGDFTVDDPPLITVDIDLGDSVDRFRFEICKNLIQNICR